jgi:Arc/MetJ-type ribon-helix-helix transcriptional regulator
MTIFLPRTLKVFVDEQVAARKYRSAEAYLTALVRAARRKEAEQELLGLVHEAEENGPATPWTTREMENIRRDGLKRLAAEKRK